MARRAIAFYEFNVAYDGRAYLPLVAGSLWAAAQADPMLRDAYEWLPVSFAHAPLDTILAAHGDRPIDVAAFSVSLWNEQLSLQVAAHLRRRHPHALIVFGGCQIPFDARAYQQDHRFIDVCARGEGERTFAAILRAHRVAGGYTSIPGLTVRTPTGSILTPDGTGPKDLDEFPSPYLTGFYEPLMAAHPEIGWQAIIETNRGCLTRGTKVVTINGEKNIEDVESGEQVLGWHEGDGRPIWNRVERCVYTGKNPVYEIRAGHQVIYATGDHPFYTKRGWVAAQELRVGEGTCQSVSCTSKTTTQKILQGMPKAVAYSKEKQIRSVSLPSHMLVGMCEAIDYQFKAGWEKSHEAFGGASSCWCDDEVAAFPHVVGKNAQGVEKSSDAGTDADERIESEHPEAIWIRDTPGEVVSEAWMSVPLYRRFRFLDRPVSVREEKKPGFCEYGSRTKENHFGTRSVLASRCAQKRARASGLSSQRLGNDDYLGGRRIESCDGATGARFCWVPIDSVTKVADADTYDLINARPFPNFFANGFLVHNCPFSCSFCYWGNALNQKYRFFSLDRVRAILTWMAAHQIRYVFNADSNFGMLPNDAAIVDTLVALKQQTGYPDKFRTCWGKNTSEKVYDLVKTLHAADLDKSLTLSRQSQDPTTLANVHRTNIRLDAYAALQRRANADGVPVYSELIFAMPGETPESWTRGIDEVLQAGCQNQLYLYHCEVLPNTAMADPAYLAQHGVVTARVPLEPIHTVVEAPGTVQEYDTIIVGTATMPAEAWVRLTVLNWALQLFHGMKAAFWPLIWQMTWARQSPTAWVQACLDAPGPLLAAERAHWEAVARGMQAGHGRAEAVGGVWWEQEEASFLRLTASKTAWIAELATYGQGDAYRASVALQDALWAPLRGQLASVVPTADNLPARLAAALRGEDPKEGWAPTPGRLVVEVPPDYGGDARAYATARVTRGRKSGTVLASWRWEPDDPSPARSS